MGSIDRVDVINHNIGARPRVLLYFKRIGDKIAIVSQNATAGAENVAHNHTGKHTNNSLFRLMSL